MTPLILDSHRQNFIEYREFLEKREALFRKYKDTTVKVTLVAITVIGGVSIGILVAAALPPVLIGQIVFGSMTTLAILLNAWAFFSEGKGYGAQQEASNALLEFDRIYGGNRR